MTAYPWQNLVRLWPAASPKRMPPAPANHSGSFVWFFVALTDFDGPLLSTGETFLVAPTHKRRKRKGTGHTPQTNPTPASAARESFCKKRITRAQQKIPRGKRVKPTTEILVERDLTHTLQQRPVVDKIRKGNPTLNGQYSNHSPLWRRPWRNRLPDCSRRNREGHDCAVTASIASDAKQKQEVHTRLRPDWQSRRDHVRVKYPNNKRIWNSSSMCSKPTGFRQTGQHIFPIIS